MHHHGEPSRPGAPARIRMGAAVVSSASESQAPEVSVVIPTRNRQAQLRTCVEAVLACGTSAAFEVVVVDDGSIPPVTEEQLPPSPALRIVTGAGQGPAVARNLGLLAARAPIVLFTDDDVVPAATWIDAAHRHLGAHPDAVAVEGPITSPPWDPLFESSLSCDSSHYWTCNIAYRKEVLERLGGFRGELFPSAQHEDRDLGVRAARLGAIGFEHGMTVSHTPRRITLRDVRRQTLHNREAMVLYALHPELSAEFRLTPRAALVMWSVRRWIDFLRAPPHPARSLRRARRALAATVVATGTAAWVAVSTPPLFVLRRRVPRTLGG